MSTRTCKRCERTGNYRSHTAQFTSTLQCMCNVHVDCLLLQITFTASKPTSSLQNAALALDNILFSPQLCSGKFYLLFFKSYFIYQWQNGSVLAGLRHLRFKPLPRHPAVEVSSPLASSSCCTYPHYATEDR